MSDKDPLLQQPPVAPPPKYDYQQPQPEGAPGYGSAPGYAGAQPQYPPPQAGYPPPQAGYPPPQAGYAPPPQAPQYGYQQAPPVPYQPPPTMAVAGTQGMYFGSSPMQMVCPHCQSTIMTNVTYEAGTLTWLSVGFLFILGFFLLISWCLCWIPLLMDGLKDIVHTCPNCHHVVGTNRRI